MQKYIHIYTHQFIRQNCTCEEMAETTRVGGVSLKHPWPAAPRHTPAVLGHSCNCVCSLSCLLQLNSFLMVFIRKGLELCTHMRMEGSVSVLPWDQESHMLTVQRCSDDGWASKGVREHAGVAGK